MQLRIYTLADAAAQLRYTNEFWPRHIRSLRKYGIAIHGVWVDTGSEGHRVVALVGYPPYSDLVQLAETYRESTDFVGDHEFFDVSLVLSVQTVTLEPTASSPLQ